MPSVPWRGWPAAGSDLPGRWSASTLIGGAGARPAWFSTQGGKRMNALARKAATTGPLADALEPRPPRAAVALDVEDLASFDHGGAENERFWERLGGQPALEGKSVLDVGSGWGRMATDLAKAGARSVLGLDIVPRLVEFATANVAARHPLLAGRVEFRCLDLGDLDPAARFDVIVSKDTFEHILDLEGMLEAMKRHLNPGGRIYAGWGPLYKSPYGDHDRRRTAFATFGLGGRLLAAVPWGHLALEPLVVSLHAERGRHGARSIRDLCLNGLGYSQYRRLIFRSGLSISRLRVNQSQSPLSRGLSLLAKVPGLDDYCIHNVYCVMERR